MTHRERFLAAVKHVPADRAVLDLCGCPQTAVEYQSTKDEMAELLGITGEKQGRGCLDLRILEKLDIDTRMTGGMIIPETSHCRKEKEAFYDSFGIGYRIVNGHYEIFHNPLKDADMDTVLSYELPDAENTDMAVVESWAEEAEYLQKKTDYAVVAEHPVYGVFELGCWMFGFEDYLYRCAAEPEIVHVFSERVWEYQKKAIEIYYDALGKYIDCTTSGDDFGTQTGLFLSVNMFNDLIKPYFKKRISYTKSLTDAFYQHHSCGSVFDLIPELIDCGVDILNPIQPGVYKMEHERLKETYGDRIAFWGGIDTQHLLPESSPDQIKEEIKRILSVMDKNGGYILSPAHCIQQDVPAENLIAIYEGAKEYYRK